MSVEIDSAVKRIRINMEALRGMTDNLRDAFEAQAEEIDKKERDLSVALLGLNERTTDLNVREMKVARREQEVMNIRQIAADRKAQLETANQVADAADVARRKAEVSQRMAETEKTRLEETVATLIREKRELTGRVEELRARLATADNLDKASELAKTL